ncbi:MAG: NAD(P)H-binding protein [Planctomycetes bacterium]|nr:NAD(P)H-binding protein [Planctomycetota bacterium]
MRCAVTGAFGYSGKYIARRLLDHGHEVITLTNSPARSNPFGDSIRAFPFHFEEPEKLEQSLHGIEVLFNTYWVRFNHKTFTFAEAVRNTLTLFQAASRAGVRRVIHVSITNASEDSPLEYFSSKGKLERALKESGLSYAILRPAVLFGKEDILVNNIAWALRRFPVFGVFGDGSYRLQPIYVDDLADLAVRLAASPENVTVDAIGPETFTYRGLVQAVGGILGKSRWILSMPPGLAYGLGWLLGKLKGDVLITRDEVRGLMADLLYVPSPPAGANRLTDWARENADSLGLCYASELARRRDRASAYER